MELVLLKIERINWCVLEFMDHPNWQIEATRWKFLVDANKQAKSCHIFRDFNQVKDNSDKLSNSTTLRGVEEFKTAIDNLHLMKINTCGGWFTWTNNRKNEAQVYERLDRFLCNFQWFDTYLNRFVENLAIAVSNHAALNLKSKQHVQKKSKSI